MGEPKPVKIKTDQLTYYRDTKTFVAFISDLGKQFRWVSVYPEAVELGVVLVSHRTKREATFYIHDTKKEEGATLKWELRPTKETLRFMPELTDVKLLVYND